MTECGQGPVPNPHSEKAVGSREPSGPCARSKVKSLMGSDSEYMQLFDIPTGHCCYVMRTAQSNNNNKNFKPNHLSLTLNNHTRERTNMPSFDLYICTVECTRPPTQTH